MKTKTLNKKLVLNKKTVANLENKKMSVIKGGVSTGVKTCWPCSYHLCSEIC